MRGARKVRGRRHPTFRWRHPTLPQAHPAISLEIVARPRDKWRTTLGLAGKRCDSLLADGDAGAARAADLERALDDGDRSLTVHVRVLAARHLKAPPGRGGSANPYAVVVPRTPHGATLDRDRLSATPPNAATLSPRWDGLPAVKLGTNACLKRCDAVRVEVLSANAAPLPPDALGSVDVPLPDDGTATTNWLPLGAGPSSALGLATMLRKTAANSLGEVLVEVARGVPPSTLARGNPPSEAA